MAICLDIDLHEKIFRDKIVCFFHMAQPYAILFLVKLL